MSTTYYIQQYDRGFSELLLFKQPVPEKIRNSVKYWLTIHGLEFHTLENASLYVSGKKPGVFLNKGEGVSHVLVKKPEDNSLWSFQVVSTDSLKQLREALTVDTVERVANYINQQTPIAEFDEFSETLARLEAERQQKWDEENRKKTEEHQRQKEEEDRKHAETMKMATIGFQKGGHIGGDTFRDLLKFHGLWLGIHPRTRNFIHERLVSIQNDGSYRYRPYLNLRGKRSLGSNKVSDLARELNKFLERAPASSVMDDICSPMQRQVS
jgi:hypothetical protein